MSRTLKVMGNHVMYMYDHSAWFLRVIMSSLRKQLFDSVFVIFRIRFQGQGKGYLPRPSPITSPTSPTLGPPWLPASQQGLKNIRRAKSVTPRAKRVTLFTGQIFFSDLAGSLFPGYGLRLRLITLTSTLIILDNTKTSCSNCLICTCIT